MKIITLSFDDGEIFDVRLAELLRKYGLQATFYLCSSHLGLKGDLPTGRHYEKVSANILRDTYQGFEIGSHGANHRGFTRLEEPELVESIRADIDAFLQYTDKPIICCAYPGGDTNEQVIDILSKSGIIQFARTTCRQNTTFAPPSNRYMCVPTAHLFDEKLSGIIDNFNAIDDESIHILHIYGHSWEVEWKRENGWKICEEIFSKLSKIQNVVFMSNGEAYKMAFAMGEK